MKPVVYFENKMIGCGTFRYAHIAFTCFSKSSAAATALLLHSNLIVVYICMICTCALNIVSQKVVYKYNGMFQNKEG